MQKLPFDSASVKNWFQKEKRNLPWRDQPTPYAVWVSEIMLQQTQVSVVIDYFLRWMERFPTIHALAAASIEEVIKLWEGLGYYNRARNLHAGARFLVENHGGELPASREQLALVKGLGPYTVGAILSFAFHQKAAAVDGNVIRILTRYFAIEEDVQKSRTLKKVWALAEQILPDDQPWLIVEGLIELGATVCKRDPECKSCPLRTGCAAYRRGIQQELPKKGKKVEITSLSRTVFVIAYKDELLLKRGEEGKVMAGLYEFPFVEQVTEEFPFSFAAQKIKKLAVVQHSFTRYKVKLYPMLWKAFEKIELPDCQWISWENVKKYPFSSGHKKIVDLLHN